MVVLITQNIQDARFKTNNLYVNKHRPIQKSKGILENNKGVTNWTDKGNIDSIKELLEKIETDMQTKTIKSTPNNPEVLEAIYL